MLSYSLFCVYVRMYDELKCKEGDNPTIVILLCSETSEDIVPYSVLHENEKIVYVKVFNISTDKRATWKRD